MYQIFQAAGAVGAALEIYFTADIIRATILGGYFHKIHSFSSFLKQTFLTYFLLSFDRLTIIRHTYPIYVALPFVVFGHFHRQFCA